jgi:hypothetical protein
MQMRGSAAGLTSAWAILLFRHLVLSTSRSDTAMRNAIGCSTYRRPTSSEDLKAVIHGFTSGRFLGPSINEDYRGYLLRQPTSLLIIQAVGSFLWVLSGSAEMQELMIKVGFINPKALPAGLYQDDYTISQQS